MTQDSGDPCETFDSGDFCEPADFLVSCESLNTVDSFESAAEVNISCYPVTPVTGLFFLLVQKYSNQGFVQNYSDLGVSCRNICQVPFRVTQSEKCILEKVTQMVF